MLAVRSMSDTSAILARVSLPFLTLADRSRPDRRFKGCTHMCLELLILDGP